MLCSGVELGRVVLSCVELRGAWCFQVWVVGQSGLKLGMVLVKRGIEVGDGGGRCWQRV